MAGRPLLRPLSLADVVMILNAPRLGGFRGARTKAPLRLGAHRPLPVVREVGAEHRAAGVTSVARYSVSSEPPAADRLDVPSAPSAKGVPWRFAKPAGTTTTSRSR